MASGHPTQAPRNFPFPAYPNGWFCVGYSDDIAIGDIVNVTYFGRPLIVWRGEDGVAHVFDAHCPHLGAHLGFGGRVDGDGIRCPFHAWRFAGDGRCTEIPYASRIPSRAVIQSYPACETNGFIFMWHHAEGKPPNRELPVLEEYGAAEWSDYVRVRWTVKSRMYDMGENPVDAQHFKYLHGGIAPSFGQVKDGRGGTKNVSNLNMKTPRGDVKGSITSEGYGPGLGIVHVKGVLHTIIVMVNAPIDDQTVDVRFNYLQPKTDDPKLLRLGEKMIQELRRQMDQDVVIFENKKYLTKPCLVPEDGPIAEYRRKARKDYSGKFWND
jgi:phenylpropionate dioxygenase-like ring-hydroxylating dioxygenase large terminal subunit